MDESSVYDMYLQSQRDAAVAITLMGSGIKLRVSIFKGARG